MHVYMIICTQRDGYRKIDSVQYLLAAQHNMRMSLVQTPTSDLTFPQNLCQGSTSAGSLHVE